MLYRLHIFDTPGCITTLTHVLTLLRLGQSVWISRLSYGIILEPGRVGSYATAEVTEKVKS